MKEKILDNTFIHYWINDHSTSDICLFFSHGVTADHRCFQRQDEFFKEKYKIINWDIPMHGQSKKENFIFYKECALLMKRILDKEKINKVVLIGLSLGGYPSQMFAHLYPGSTMGLVAIDTTPFGLKYYSNSDIFLLKQVGWSTKCFPTNLLKKSMAKSISKIKYSYELMMEMLNESSKDVIARQMEIAYSKFILENQDIKLDRDILVLLLLGDSDKTGKIKQYCMAWQKETNYPLHIIKNASHFSNSDNSESVNDEIENFIKKICKV
ncbi:alpha/beta hydrolase fold protein [Neocallimastix lanati (nom. inval.)]|uniref:Alpha/beta hydrolase fold protein n=1 Tax=Neocallimastix californiae TaxID=1754190 RepID=A0A1Y2ACE3_9FUNG|nr:alpha/beta hydrolase fold protein [Neocallimastix sp. JGI-2020a]ORY20233.1 alpha/beta hydrolase fold protein [Neocallimastix californiae]|eukprot:ORY20233.1 alpha/beta hydrolase fold protein [Neocallimastix californiae]